MRSWRALLIMAALRIARTEDDAALPLEIYKCCGPYEMLSGDGSACVNASWPRNHTLRERPQSDHFDLPQVLVQPGDAPWVARWLPPGVPPQRVGEVHVGFLYPFKRKYPERQMWTVETSAEWDERQVEAAGSAYFSRRVVFIKTEYGSVMGPEPRPFFGSVLMGLGGYRPLGTYCVDAAQAPLAPFVLMAQPDCGVGVCLRKCCPEGEVVQVKDGGGWGCRMDRERAAGWPRRSSFAALPPFQNAAEYYDRY
ncbi:hypothetical protein R5R35_010915 [Gryllus longicercus]|uniref:Accessory gland protein n=1 Tax=Gryllus longicercus TaxID=2509291 RepID=A0AAN9VR37_9ORTH